MSIQEHLNKIRNAVYGHEVRESIAKGIETAYDDASEKDNANMEVKIARGTHPNLRSRLEEVDNKQKQTTAQLAQKAQQSDLDTTKSNVALKADKSEVRMKSVKLELEDMSETTLGAMSGNATFNLLSVPQDGSVTPVKLDNSIPSAIESVANLKLEYGVNLFNKNKALADTILSVENPGEIDVTIGFSTSDFTPVLPSKEISIATPRRIAEYDMFKKYIPNTFRDISNSVDTTLTTNAKTHYVRFSIITTSLGNGQVKLGANTTKRYPYSGKAILKQKDGKEVYVDHVVNNRYEIKAGGKNLFDKNKASAETSVSVNGITVSSVGWITSDFTEVPQGSVLINRVRYIHEYDKYFEPVIDSYVDLGAVANDYVFTPKPNTKYIRFTYYSTSTPIQVEKGTLATSYEEHYYSAFLDGKKVFDFKYGGSVPQERVIDESTIDYPNVNLKKVDLISNFDDGSWILNTGAGGTITDDTNNVTYGTKSLKLTTTDPSRGEVSKTVSLDIVDKVFVMKLFIEDVNKVKTIQVTFFNDDKSDYYGYYPPVSQLKTGWNLIAIPTDFFSKKDANTNPNIRSSIKHIYVSTTAKTSATVNITLDMFGLAKNAIKRGKIVLQFDDAWDGVWKYAKPAMDKYGFRGTIYVIEDLVDVNQFMTLQQLQTVYNNGWDLGTHGQVELTTLTTPANIRTELLKNYNYLINNGFTRSAKHYCTPAGKYNDMSLTEIKKIFLTHRTTEFRYNALPVADRYRLGNISGNESDITFLKSIADNTEKYKSLTVINWHQIVETPTGNESMTPALASTFREFIDYIATKNIDVVTLSDIFNPMD